MAKYLTKKQLVLTQHTVNVLLDLQIAAAKNEIDMPASRLINAMAKVLEEKELLDEVLIAAVDSLSSKKHPRLNPAY